MSLQEYFNYNINISTSANIVLTNCTIPNIVNTNTSTGSLNSINLLSTFNTLTNLIYTSATGTSLNLTGLSATNLTTTNLTTSNIQVSGNMTVGGNLTVVGSLTSVNVTSINVIDNNITAGSLNANAATITNLFFTNGSVSSFSSTNITTTNLVSNFTSLGNLTSSTGTFANKVGGSQTVGTLVVTTSASLIGNTNTIGNIFTTGGNVGINTPSPSFTLDVAGTGRFTGAITQVGGGRDTSFVATATGAGQAGIALDSTAGGGNRYNIYSDPASKQLQFFNVTTTNSSLNLDSRGNFGIGVTNPQFTLDVSGNIRCNYNSFAGITLIGSSNDINMRINNTAAGGTSFLIGCGATGSTSPGNFYIFDSVSNNFRVNINSAGNIGFGTVTPAYPLHVIGSSTNTVTGGYYFAPTTSTLQPFSTSPQPISIFANLAILTQSNFLASSDLRIKNICDEEINLNLIDLINPVIYTYKDKIKNSKKNIGFIAQNVFEHCPEAVTLHKEIIPDIMKLVNIIENKDTIITIKNEWLLNEKDVIKIMVDDKDTAGELVDIIYSNKDIIKFKHSKLKQKVFVYGRQIDDFHELNYDYVFALGFAGIQKSRKEIKELKQDNILLKQDIDKLTNFIKLKFPTDF